MKFAIIGHKSRSTHGNPGFRLAIESLCHIDAIAALRHEQSPKTHQDMAHRPLFNPGPWTQFWLISVFWALLKNYKELLHIKCTNRLPLTYRMCVRIIFHLLHFLVHVLLDHRFQRNWEILDALPSDLVLAISQEVLMIIQVSDLEYKACVT